MSEGPKAMPQPSRWQVAILLFLALLIDVGVPIFLGIYEWIHMEGHKSLLHVVYYSAALSYYLTVILVFLVLVTGTSLRFFARGMKAGHRKDIIQEASQKILASAVLVNPHPEHQENVSARKLGVDVVHGEN